MNKAVEKYLPMVDFLASFLGQNSEVVLHDFSDLEHSVVAIKNNHVSGRDIGAPVTDLVLKILKDNQYTDVDYLPSYPSRNKDGKALKSSSYFIRDGKKIVGMLCINSDVSMFFQLHKISRQLADTYIYSDDLERTDIKVTVEDKEQLSESSSDLISRRLSHFIIEKGISAERLTQEDRIDFIRNLNNEGLFLLKGAVAKIADILSISEPSVYRYLQKVRKESKTKIES